MTKTKHEISSISSHLRSRKWTRDSYLISTDTSLIPVASLAAALASDTFYWAKPLPEPYLTEILQSSLCFGLYSLPTNNTSPETAEHMLRKRASGDAADGPTPEFIGFARVITDYATVAFVTDVWVDTSTQGQGLGKWLVNCVQEVLEGMPHLRRSMLFTGDWERSVPFYERLMKMEVIGGRPGEGLAVMQMKGRGHPDYVDEAV